MSSSADENSSYIDPQLVDSDDRVFDGYIQFFRDMRDQYERKRIPPAEPPPNIPDDRKNIIDEGRSEATNHDRASRRNQNSRSNSGSSRKKSTISKATRRKRSRPSPRESEDSSESERDDDHQEGATSTPRRSVRNERKRRIHEPLFAIYKEDVKAKKTRSNRSFLDRKSSSTDKGPDSTDRKLTTASSESNEPSRDSRSDSEEEIFRIGFRRNIDSRPDSEEISNNSIDSKMKSSKVVDTVPKKPKTLRSKISSAINRSFESSRSANPITNTSHKPIVDRSISKPQERPSPAQVSAATAPKPEEIPESAPFISIDQLDSVPDRAFVNIRGTVQSVGPEQTLPFGIGPQSNVSVRRIYVEDESGTVQVSLFRNFANDPNIQPNASIVMYGLKKDTYQERPRLATVSDKTRIEPSPTASLNLTTLSPQKPSADFKIYEIDGILKPTTNIYPACPNPRCHFKKVDDNRQCPTCRSFYEYEALEIGITTKISITDEILTTAAKIFTPSIRKLCPNLAARKWQIDRPVEEFRDEINLMIDEILPKRVVAKERDGNLDISRIAVEEDR